MDLEEINTFLQFIVLLILYFSFKCIPGTIANTMGNLLHNIYKQDQ